MKQKEYKEQIDSNNIKKEGEMRTSTKRRIKNGFGLGLIVFGIYLLLVYFGIIPFTPRFQTIFNDMNAVLVMSIILIVIGAILNDSIRNFFRR